MSDLTPEDLEHFASGTMPHERPSEVDIYRDEMKGKLTALAAPYGFLILEDVIDVLDGKDP